MTAGAAAVKNTGCNWVNANSITINGVLVDPASSYRITVNNFMADGGDNYIEFKNGTNRLGGAVDIDALASGESLPVEMHWYDIAPGTDYHHTLAADGITQTE